jgi:hypothetical protein
VNAFARAFFHPLPQAALSIVFGVLGAAAYHGVTERAPISEERSDPFAGTSLRSHWGIMSRPDGKDAATTIVGNSDERLRFVGFDGATLGLCACVTYDDLLDAPRMQRDCVCTAGSRLTLEPR